MDDGAPEGAIGVLRVRLRVAVSTVGSDGETRVFRRSLGGVAMTVWPDDRIGDLVVAAVGALAGDAGAGQVGAGQAGAGQAGADQASLDREGPLDRGRTGAPEVGASRRLDPGEIDRGVAVVGGAFYEADDPVPVSAIRHGDVVTVVGWCRGSRTSVDELLGHGPAVAPSWRLAIRTPDGSAASEAVLPLGPSVVGRGECADVELDEPLVSRAHVRLHVGTSVLVEDLGSTNGTSVDGTEIAGPTRLDAGARLVVGETTLELCAGPATPPSPSSSRGAAHADAASEHGALPLSPGADESPLRAERDPSDSPAVGERLVDPLAVSMPSPVRSTFMLPEVPRVADRPSMPWGAVVIPMVMAIALVTMARRMGGGAGTWVWWSVAFLALGPLTALGSFAESRWSWAKRRRRSRVAALTAVDDVVGAAAEARIAELERRRTRHPSPRRLVERASQPHLGLWSCAASFDGSVRVGHGEEPTAVEFLAHHGAPWSRADRADVDEEVVAAIDGAVAAFATHPNAPITLELWPEPTGVDSGERGSGSVVALTGPVPVSTGVALAMVLGLLSELPPDDLSVTVVASSARATAWSCLAWLPARVRVTAVDESNRSDEPMELGRGRRHLVVVDGWAEGARLPAWASEPTASTSPHQVGAGGPTGSWARCPSSIAVLWLGPSDRVPAAARTLIAGVATPIGPPDGTITDLQTGVVRTLALDHVTELDADAWAASLAPWRARSVGSAARPLPERVSLVALHPSVSAMRSLDPSAADIAAAVSLRAGWAAASPAPRALLGRGPSGDLAIDLRSDGPHTLVAGTTGAGKSELLRTFVASLAIHHSPAQVSMLLVDYKGGAAFGCCAELPHVVGVVTDLDEALATRALVSLRAEVRRREEILARHGAKDLADLEARAPGAAPPSLVVVIDEFASLVAEVPMFVDGVIDLARRGRSLGVHLVLATQRPAGVVNDHVLANTNLRIALRLADQHESRDLVGVPEAAAIARDRPGRALVRLGAGEVVEVQTAYGGAPVPMVSPSSAGRLGIRPLTFSTPFSVPDRRSAIGSVEDRSPVGPTELDAIVDAVRHAAVGMAPPRRPWLDPLPSRISASDLWSSHGPAGGHLPLMVGLLDDPERSEQRPLCLDLADGSVTVVGPNVATADVVLAFVTAVVRGRDPRELRVDVIDGGLGSLGALAALPQVGSVVAPDDLDRIRRVLGPTSPAPSSAAGPRAPCRSAVALATDARSAPAAVTDRIIVVHDVVGLVERLERSDPRSVEALVRLAHDGAAIGVHLLLCADRRVGLPPALASAVARRIVLRLASADDERSFGGDPALSGAAPGRAVIEGRALQLGSLDEDGPASLSGVATAERRRWGDVEARPIPTLPERVTFPLLGCSDPGSGDVWPGLVVAIDDDLVPVSVELEAGNLLIAGPPRSGRTTALAAVGEASRDARGLHRVLVAPRRGRSAATDHAGWDDVAFDRTAVVLLDALGQRVRQGERVLVAVDDATELSSEVDEALMALVAASRHDDVRIVMAVESAAARRSYDGAVAALRRDRRGLLLQPDVELDGDLVGLRLTRRVGRTMPPGRGEFVDRGVARLVQVAMAEALVASTS